jgi:hypothetical protein
MKNSPKETLRWPRPGYPLVPALYRKIWLDEPLPEAVLARAGLPPYTTVGFLDELVWEEVENPEALQALASYVSTLVKSRLYFRGDPVLADQPVLGNVWNTAIDPRGLPFTERTRNVLERAGRLEDTEWLSAVTASEFLSLRGAGAISLLDFATVAEAHEATSHSWEWESEVEAIEQELRKLRAEYPIDSISPEDPRLRNLGLVGLSVAEALDREIHDKGHRLFTLQIDQALARVAAVRGVLRRLEAEKLDEALLHLVRQVVSARHVDAIAMRLGWDGMGGATLEEAGEVVGVTRERVRQIQTRLEDALKPVAYVPALDRAIETLDRAADTFEPDAASLLRREGITFDNFLPAGVVSAAKMLGRPYRFKVGPDKISVQLPGDTKTKIFQRALRSLSDMNHVASVLELQARILEAEGEEPPLETVRAFVERHPNVAWLDDNHSWFWVRQGEGRNRVVGQIRKMLAVAGSLPLESLREGTLRHHRTKNTVLPRSVFEGLCRAAGLQVRDGAVSASKPIRVSKVLGRIETTMVDVLTSHGGVMRSTDLEDQCLKRGVNRHSFWVYLIYSPVLERVAPSVYALRGAKIDPVEVAHLAGKDVPTEPALQDDGWTKDGAIWLGYRVKRNILSSGVVAVRAGVRNMIGERRLELYAVDGASVGTLVVSTTGNAWGLTPFIGRRGVEVGDGLIIALDTDLGVAVVQAGSKDLLLTYQDGDGWGPRHFLEEATQPLDDEPPDES